MSNLKRCGLMKTMSTLYNDIDATVFWWDTRSYKEIFKHGFKPWSQGKTPNSVYYNLYDYVHHGGKPLNFDRLPFERHVFASATNNLSWTPLISTKILAEETPLRFYLCKVIQLCIVLKDSYDQYY